MGHGNPNEGCWCCDSPSTASNFPFAWRVASIVSEVGFLAVVGGDGCNCEGDRCSVESRSWDSSQPAPTTFHGTCSGHMPPFHFIIIFIIFIFLVFKVKSFYFHIYFIYPISLYSQITLLNPLKFQGLKFIYLFIYLYMYSLLLLLF